MEPTAARAKKKALTSQRGQGGGARVKVKESVWDAWRTHLQTQPVQHWTAHELAKFFVEMGGIRYSHSHWSQLLREREGMYFYKPRPRDYRRSDEAPEQLADRIEATFDALKAMGYDLGRVRWGFADETAAQLHSNNARFWAFEPGLSRVVNTDRGSRSFFGFYGMNACSDLVALSNGKKQSIQDALLAVKAAQTDCDALVVFWDNASTHKALEYVLDSIKPRVCLILEFPNYQDHERIVSRTNRLSVASYSTNSGRPTPAVAFPSGARQSDSLAELYRTTVA